MVSSGEHTSGVSMVNDGGKGREKWVYNEIIDLKERVRFLERKVYDLETDKDLGSVMR